MFEFFCWLFGNSRRSTQTLTLLANSVGSLIKFATGSLPAAILAPWFNRHAASRLKVTELGIKTHQNGFGARRQEDVVLSGSNWGWSSLDQ